MHTNSFLGTQCIVPDGSANIMQIPSLKQQWLWRAPSAPRNLDKKQTVLQCLKEEKTKKKTCKRAAPIGTSRKERYELTGCVCFPIWALGP